MAKLRPDEPETPQTPTASLSPTTAFELEMVARMSAVLIVASSGLVPTLAPNWAWAQNHHFLVTLGSTVVAFLVYALIQSFAHGKADNEQGSA